MSEAFNLKLFHALEHNTSAILRQMHTSWNIGRPDQDGRRLVIVETVKKVRPANLVDTSDLFLALNALPHGNRCRSHIVP